MAKVKLKVVSVKLTPIEVTAVDELVALKRYRSRSHFIIEAVRGALVTIGKLKRSAQRTINEQREHVRKRRFDDHRG